jgi:hypothetical protein
MRGASRSASPGVDHPEEIRPDAARYITHETPIVSEQSLLRPALDVVVDDLLRAAVREFDSKLLTIKCGDDAIAELLVRHAVTDSVAGDG